MILQKFRKDISHVHSRKKKELINKGFLKLIFVMDANKYTSIKINHLKKNKVL